MVRSVTFLIGRISFVVFIHLFLISKSDEKVPCILGTVVFGELYPNFFFDLLEDTIRQYP